MVLRVKDEQVAWVYALTDETWKMTSGFTVTCMLHELVGLSQRVLFLLGCFDRFCYDALRLLCLKQDRKLYSFA